MTQTHSQLASEHDDFAPGLLLAESPLHQILPAIAWQAHVPPGHGGVGGARQDVRLCLVVGVHAVGVGHPQRVIVTHLVTAPTLV